MSLTATGLDESECVRSLLVDLERELTASRSEQIQAKQAAHQKSAYHASFSALSTGESSPTKRSLKRHAGQLDGFDAADSISAPITPQDIHKRNAMMSRLGSVADVVAMRLNGRPMLFEEVCTAVANSPLLSIGFGASSFRLSLLTFAHALSHAQTKPTSPSPSSLNTSPTFATPKWSVASDGFTYAAYSGP